ncbi:MAG: protein phosphatase 2C domain-containing protein, partial [Oscillospiraceae bacterium]|nr:protein phosphatase 2C domain-containing protein [Oscillospiraceae bacterium]
MTLAGYTDIGYKYEENQDCYRAGKINDSLGWMLLCDGMGGLSHGKTASHIAVDIVSSAMGDELLNVVTPQDKAAYLTIVCQKANRAVFDASVRIGGNQMMGTTMVLAVVDGQDATILHCGDSRVYHYQRRTMKQLTRDHSYVQELIDA